MHNSYYLLKPLAKQLKGLINSAFMVSIFSQDKDELIIEMKRADTWFYLKVVMTPDISILTFPAEIHRARKNSVDLFPELLGAAIEDVISFDKERCLALKFNSGYFLLFKMFGHQANTLLFLEHKPVAIFKNHLKNDWHLQFEELAGNEANNFEAFEAMGCDYKRAFPTFGSRVAPFLKEHNYDEASPEKKWEILQGLKDILLNPSYSLIKTDGQYRFYLLPTTQAIEQYADPIAGLNDFYQRYLRDYQFNRNHQAGLKLLIKKQKQAEAALERAEKRREQLVEQVPPREMGDLIMAHMHEIPPRSSQVELVHFYTQQPVTIKLKKDLTPQANAAHYYRKSKNQKIEQDQLELQIEEKAQELERLQQQILALNQVQDLQELKKYFKQHPLDSYNATPQVTIPFRTFECMGYTIWVGKSAKNNDLLTQKFAKKNDLWLHAKDVSGSHVVVRYQGGNYPQPVIERAASLAAYFSKRKHENLCPVAYTEKKFVRKPKGALAGKVVVEREKVLLVKPEL